MPYKLLVLEEWVASYDDPIQVSRGDVLNLTGKVDTWDGHKWVWAVAPDGREGWVPDDFLEINGDTALARSDYSAQELSCSLNERLTGKRETHGWTWCTNDKGRSGWVPSRMVKRA